MILGLWGKVQLIELLNILLEIVTGVIEMVWAREVQDNFRRDLLQGFELALKEEEHHFCRILFVANKLIVNGMGVGLHLPKGGASLVA